jgi:hypothetical protein
MGDLGALGKFYSLLNFLGLGTFDQFDYLEP